MLNKRDFYYNIRNYKGCEPLQNVKYFMQELPEINKRFLEAIESTGLSGYKVAKRVKEITDSKLTHIRSGRNGPSEAMINGLVREFPEIDKVWILTGVKQRSAVIGALPSEIDLKKLLGIKVKNPLEFFNTKAGSQYEELPGGKYKLTVPYVPVRAQATYLMEYTDAEYMSDLSTVTFIVDRVGKGKYVAFEVQNDSMNDGTINAIPDGTIVLARELGRQHWKSRFRTRDFPNWIIVHKSTILCKEIIDHDVENGVITCHSLNDSPEYQDFQVRLDDVKQLFNIVKRQLP